MYMPLLQLLKYANHEENIGERAAAAGLNAQFTKDRSGWFIVWNWKTFRFKIRPLQARSSIDDVSNGRIQLPQK